MKQFKQLPTMEIHHTVALYISLLPELTNQQNSKLLVKSYIFIINEIKE